MRSYRYYWRVVLYSSLLGVQGVGVANGQVRAGYIYAKTPLAQIAVMLDRLGTRIPSDFMGLSIEYPAVKAYLGATPAYPNAVFRRLLTNLGAGSLRIGGDSQDTSCWNTRSGHDRTGCAFTITPSLPAVAFSTAAATNWRVIMGINLAISNPSAARTYVTDAILPSSLSDTTDLLGLEIGNEPDIYSQYHLRPPRYSFAHYLHEFEGYVKMLKGSARTDTLPLVGPAFVTQEWDRQVGPFVAATGAHNLAFLTLHYYPFSACSIPSAAAATDIALLSDGIMTALAQRFSRDVAVARAYGLPLRVGETNSVSCHGKAGVSDSFASALWGLDVLFTLAKAGLRGVNFHIYDLDRSPGYYNPIVSAATETAPGTWVYSTGVRPLYYAMLLFGRAVGYDFLPVTLSGAAANIKAYAVRNETSVRVFVLNKDSKAVGSVVIAPSRALGTATITYLRAPTLSSTTGTTLGDQVVDRRTGALPRPHALAIMPNPDDHTYRVPVPVASAVMVTLRVGSPPDREPYSAASIQPSANTRCRRPASIASRRDTHTRHILMGGVNSTRDKLQVAQGSRVASEGDPHGTG